MRLIFHREDVERILAGAVESGRLLAGQGGSSYEFLRGYAAALRIVCTSFGVETGAMKCEICGSADDVVVRTCLGRNTLLCSAHAHLGHEEPAT